MFGENFNCLTIIFVYIAKYQKQILRKSHLHRLLLFVLNFFIRLSLGKLLRIEKNDLF